MISRIFRGADMSRIIGGDRDINELYAWLGEYGCHASTLSEPIPDRPGYHEIAMKIHFPSSKILTLFLVSW